MQYIYGPVPSRRLGLSLGVSPIPKKTCNYSCIYCQLGRTRRMINQRQEFFPLEDIVQELDTVLGKQLDFDVITIVGEGEPTLYSPLGELIQAIKERTDRPVAVITNGALLYDERVREGLALADLVLPSLDAWDQASFRRINRPHGSLDYEKVLEGLTLFSVAYSGQLWLEVMLMEGVNDDPESLALLSGILNGIPYDRLYLNTPVRPPAEADVRPVSRERMEEAVALLGGIAIDLLVSEGFYSELEDDYEAVLGIIRRHPMNQHEIESFLKTRGREEADPLLRRLREDPAVAVHFYKGYESYRLE